LFCSNEAQAKRFHDIFESLDETNAENIRKQYTIVLPLYQVLLMKKTKLPATRITRFFERYHKFIKTAIRKNRIT
jgi:transcription-repair coupling factor (superfamily II helicase)